MARSWETAYPPNAIDDFIAPAEWLLAKKYTTLKSADRWRIQLWALLRPRLTQRPTYSGPGFRGPGHICVLMVCGYPTNLTWLTYG